MEKRLINRLLKLVQNDEGRVQETAMLKDFSKTYGLGCLVGTQIEFSEKDKALIKRLLIQGEGVDPDKVKAGQFNDLTRAEVSKLASNEKLTTRSVREDRIAVKALPDQALLLDSGSLKLPDGSNLDVNWHWLRDNTQYSSIMAVENWEVFENIHKINFDLTQYADNPLVIFRGGDEYNQKMGHVAFRSHASACVLFWRNNPLGGPMKIQLQSDLHLEFAEFEANYAAADVSVLAGDIHVGTKGIEWAVSLGLDIPVVYVAGNHEYYHHAYPTLQTELRAVAAGSNVHFLENESLELDGVAFHGATLWTDFKLYGKEWTGKAMARYLMPDYKIIWNEPDASYLTPGNLQSTRLPQGEGDSI